MPLGVFNSLCAHNDKHISVGIHCLFLYVGSCRNLEPANKQKEVPRFLYAYMCTNTANTLRLEPVENNSKSNNNENKIICIVCNVVRYALCRL